MAIEHDYSDELFDEWKELEAEPEEPEPWTDPTAPREPKPWELPLTPAMAWALKVVGWYSPMTIKGARTAIYKRVGQEKGAVLLTALEGRGLVRVVEGEGGRSVWKITGKGVRELGEKYSPRKEGGG